MDRFAQRARDQADLRDHGSTLEPAASEHVGKMRRRAPASEFGPRQRRQRLTMIHRIEQAERTTQHHRRHQLHDAVPRREGDAADDAVAGDEAERLGAHHRAGDDVRRRAEDGLRRAGGARRLHDEAVAAQRLDAAVSRHRIVEEERNEPTIQRVGRVRRGALRQDERQAAQQRGAVGPRRGIGPQENHRRAPRAQRREQRDAVGRERDGGGTGDRLASETVVDDRQPAGGQRFATGSRPPAAAGVDIGKSGVRRRVDSRPERTRHEGVCPSYIQIAGGHSTLWHPCPLSSFRRLRLRTRSQPGRALPRRRPVPSPACCSG